MLALSSRSCLHADIGILPQSTTVLTHTHRAVSVAVASVVARCRMTDGNMKGGGGSSTQTSIEFSGRIITIKY